MELAGDLRHIGSLIVGSACAFLTAELLRSRPIYETLLREELEEQMRPELRHLPAGRGSRLHER
jgi:hypothetical protein